MAGGVLLEGGREKGGARGPAERGSEPSLAKAPRVWCGAQRTGDLGGRVWEVCRAGERWRQLWGEARPRGVKTPGTDSWRAGADGGGRDSGRWGRDLVQGRRLFFFF